MLKVGDRVMTPDRGLGTIKVIDGKWYGVEHDDPGSFYGHDCNGHTKTGKGYWYREDNIKVLTLKKKKEKEVVVWLLIAFGLNEDRVLEVSMNEKDLKRKRAWLEANLGDYEYGLIRKRLK